jgi:hypothetical protein
MASYGTRTLYQEYAALITEEEWQATRGIDFVGDPQVLPAEAVVV